MEPLLKEEKEEFGFKKEPVKKENNNKVSLVITIILSVVICLVFFKTARAFYVGFKYYDEGHPKIETTEVKDEEEQIDANSMLLKELTSTIKVNSDIVAKVIYTSKEVNFKDLSDDFKLALVFNLMGLSCDNSLMDVSISDMNPYASKLFTDTLFVNNIDVIAIDNYTITNNNGLYNISLNNSCTNDIVYTKINKATIKDDYLYIYQGFGYFVNTGDNKYQIYADANRETFITDFVDYNGNIDISGTSMLKEYKWSLKKYNDTYIIESIIPL